MGIKQKPGEIPNKPGEYIERGTRGGMVAHPRQATIRRRSGKLPPTQKKGYIWEWIGPARG